MTHRLSEYLYKSGYFWGVPTMTKECPADMPLETVKNEYLAFLKERGFCAGIERVRIQTSYAFSDDDNTPGPCAVGRVTAEPVYAQTCSPYCPSSAVDGIALDTRRTVHAANNILLRLNPEQFTVVYTGDPIPEDCDAVIMTENIRRNSDGSVTIRAPASPWQNIRQTGEDVCAGEMILPAHTRISTAAMAAMIAGGVSCIKVIKRPVVGIIQTDCNMDLKSSVLIDMLHDWETVGVVMPRTGNDTDGIASAIKEYYDSCDMFIVCLGPSPEHSRGAAEAIEAAGELFCSGLGVRPGRDTVLGAVGTKPVLGIPGYPVSGMIIMEELVKPITEYLNEKEFGRKKYADAVLNRSFVSFPEYEEFVRVRMGYVGDKLTATPLSRSSGVVSAFMKADGILEIPRSCRGYEAGDTVRVRLLRDEKTLKNTLVTVGSHDPLLDELADMMHTRDRSIYMSSAHVGSVGGIMAIRRGEAHAAGCHLLDTATGEYNLSFMRKYFPNGDVKLVRCVGRQQGLMIQKGNPLGITGFEDIGREGLRYVNRQKGSGTRILTDYLSRRYGIRTDVIYGYDREEMTHTAAAAQIACGSADVGMGIYSAARLYDLNFIPVCAEEYDLIIPDYAWDTPMVRLLLETIKSEAFREKILAMGGYTLENPGEIIEYMK